MAYKVKQFRYYNDASSESAENKRNQPAYLASNSDTYVTYQHYVNGDVFGTCFPIVQLGIQALPGTKFYLNEAVDPIIIGTTGIYELDLEDGIQVTRLSVAADSMTKIKDNDNAYLLVDIIYDDGEA